MKRFLKACFLGLVLIMFLTSIGTGVSYGATYNRSNPTPIGVKQTVTVDNYFEHYRMEMTVTEAIRGHEAWNMIYDANRFNSPPAYDEEYILAKIRVKLLYSQGDKRVDISSVYFNLYNSNNVEYNFNFVVEPQPQLDTSLYQGSEHEGYAAFLVKKLDSNPKIVFGEKYDGTGGVWFKFTRDGALNRGWVNRSDNWYYYNNNGVMQTGWLLNGDKWYYLTNNGVMQTDWVLTDGKWYYLDNSGAMRTGWLNHGGNWYYLNSGSGAMQTGWFFTGGQWYYLSDSGVMRTGWVLDGGNWYYLSGSGSMSTGWLLNSNKWYYLSGSGVMQKGWIWNGGNWYYLYSNGVMAANTAIGGYKLGSNGAILR